MRFDRVLWIIGFAAGCSSVACGATLEMAASRDNTLYEDATGALSNGAGDYLFAGLTGGSSIRRALIMFDVAAAIPPGSSITACTLTLHMDKTTAGANPVTAHRMSADWGEGASDASENEGQGGPATENDATWISPFNTEQLWANPGGDFLETASATASVVGTGFYTWSGSQMTADVQSWLADGSSNFGWVLIGNESGSGSAKRFESRSNPITTNRPVLSITFDAPSSVKNWTLY